MKFYGNGYVWDKQENKMLCQFVDGVFETVDKRTADTLTDLGYESDGLGVLAENDVDDVDDVETNEDVTAPEETEQTESFVPEETEQADAEENVLTTLDAVPTRKARR